MSVSRGQGEGFLDIHAVPTLVRAVFTGLIEGLGKLVQTEGRGDGLRLTLDVGCLAEGVRPGDSIALNGCCLTVTAMDGVRLSFDLLRETVIRTNLQALKLGGSVNLERALAANARLGGHFVTGHIDAPGKIKTWGPLAGDHELRIGVAPDYMRYLVPKGCIAVDGISLTVADVTADEFSVWIIPHTREVTALRERAAGDHVNLEFDLLAKYAEKILSAREA